MARSFLATSPSLAWFSIRYECNWRVGMRNRTTNKRQNSTVVIHPISPFELIEVMNRFKITTTKNGKCDVTLTIFDNDNSIVGQKSSTYDIKPTVKELLEYAKTYKKVGAKTVRISSTPSCCVKTYKL